MKFRHRLALAFSALALGLAVNIILLVSVLNATLLDRNQIKGLFNQTGMHEHLIDNFIAPQIRQSFAADPQTKILTADMMVDSLNQSLPPAFVKAQTEKVIDSSYDWLNGKTDRVQFTIPLEQPANQFYATIRSRLVANLKALPPCRTANVSYDQITSATCLPRSIAAETAADQIVGQIKTEGQLFAPALTEQTFAPPTGQQDNTNTIAAIPMAVHWLYWLHILAWPLAAAAIAGIIYLNQPRIKGIRTIGFRILLPGFVYVLIGYLALRRGGSLQTAILIPDTAHTPIPTILDPLLHIFLPALGRAMVLFGGITTAIGTALVITFIVLAHKQKKASVQTPPPAPISPIAPTTDRTL
jgi:hypothetical protein